MPSSRFKALRRNKFLLFWCRFFTDLNALQAIIQLFYLHRGVSMSEIFYLGIAWSLATIIFDIPTSIIADKWGRKKSIVLGVLINILANASLFFCHGFIPFFVSTFFLSISFSFFSGIEDAFLFDTLKEMGQESVVLKTSGKYSIAAKLSKMFTPLIGVLIAANLSSIQFNILLAINLVSSCVAIIFALMLVEPKRTHSQSDTHLSTLKDSLLLIKESPIIRKIVLNKTLIFIASFVFWKYYQKPLTDMGVTVLALGILYPIFNTLTIFVYARTEQIFRRFSKRFIFEFPVWITLVGCLLFTISTNSWFSCLLSVFLVITGIIRDPFFNQQIQWRLKSHNRSTSGSVLNLLKSFLDIPLLFLSGYLASFGTAAVMSVPVILSLIVLVFFRIDDRDIVHNSVQQ